MPIEPFTAFVSYSRGDLEFVLRLAQSLRSSGAKVWLDKLDIRPGQLWEATIQDAVDQCPRMLVVLSPSAILSKNVLAEASFAIDEGKELIPILYKDCKIPLRLRPFQYADFRGDYAAGVAELLGALGIAKEPVAAPKADDRADEKPPERVVPEPVIAAGLPAQEIVKKPRRRPPTERRPEAPVAKTESPVPTARAKVGRPGRVAAVLLGIAAVATITVREVSNSWNRSRTPTLVPAAPATVSPPAVVPKRVLSEAPPGGFAVLPAAVKPVADASPSAAALPEPAGRPAGKTASIRLSDLTLDTATPKTKPAKEPETEDQRKPSAVYGLGKPDTQPHLPVMPGVVSPLALAANPRSSAALALYLLPIKEKVIACPHFKSSFVSKAASVVVKLSIDAAGRVTAAEAALSFNSAGPSGDKPPVYWEAVHASYLRSFKGEGKSCVEKLVRSATFLPAATATTVSYRFEN